MCLNTGELAALKGKLILMTATATRHTVRLLMAQFPEVNDWKLILNVPERSNVTLLIPPPHHISPNFQDNLAPFVERMVKFKEVCLIIVRGRFHGFSH